MSGIVESVGSLGLANRSDERSVYTLGVPASWRNAAQLRRVSRENGNTRGQLKFPGNPEMIPVSARHLVDAVFYPSAALNSLSVQRGIIFMSANAEARVDLTLQNQWAIAQRVWGEPIHITPQERLSSLQTNGYHFDSMLSSNDEVPLHQAWRPFGWTTEGVKQFINTYDPNDPAKAGWFACMRNSDGMLCSAAKAEALTIGDIQVIESTEWGTHSNMRGKGLGTGAVIALNHAILNHPPRAPYVIMAEANLDPNSPGHRVARDVGFSPAGADMNDPMPNHVLRAHVSVDGALRSFLPVQLTPDAITQYYSS